MMSGLTARSSFLMRWRYDLAFSFQQFHMLFLAGKSAAAYQPFSHLARLQSYWVSLVLIDARQGCSACICLSCLQEDDLYFSLTQNPA